MFCIKDKILLSETENWSVETVESNHSQLFFLEKTFFIKLSPFDCDMKIWFSVPSVTKRTEKFPLDGKR